MQEVPDEDIEACEGLFAMSNVRGKQVVQPYKLPFSFYFSSRYAYSDSQVAHGIRVKPSFNPERMNYRTAGTLKLSDDWKFIPGKDDKAVSNKDIRKMKQFFRDYKVLFAAVWEDVLQENVVLYYFSGIIDWNELLSEFDCYTKAMDKIKDVVELEEFVRANNLFNMND